MHRKPSIIGVFGNVRRGGRRHVLINRGECRRKEIRDAQRPFQQTLDHPDPKGHSRATGGKPLANEPDDLSRSFGRARLFRGKVRPNSPPTPSRAQTMDTLPQAAGRFRRCPAIATTIDDKSNGHPSVP
ncbi:hypothetical protein ZHAS_00015013 [Anopheles sinensis]|uniref:Uncharacterized protein n=1 Tax=Anopheles sinensis TaxID=74873 RepID=A0A084W9T3_ANOSI|nr:hypothetical protein ZHAS_00015013 [Anopheles sinensis]